MKSNNRLDDMALRGWRVALKGQPLFRSRNAVLFGHGGTLYKFYRPRHFISDYIRRYFGRSLARREADDYAILERIGLRVPRIHGTRTLWNPLSAFESVTAIEFLQDKITAHEYLLNAPAEVRLKILANITDDLQRMWNAWVLHGDLRFGNIMVGGDLVPYWLDPGLQRFQRYAPMRKATDRAIGRMVRLNYDLIGPEAAGLFFALKLPKHRTLRY